MNKELSILWNNVKNSNEVRQSLSKIRAMIKEADVYDELSYILSDKENSEILLKQLSNEDAKTRKNAALLLGDMAGYILSLTDDMVMENLYFSYISEKQLFVKSSYLTALKNYDYRDYIEKLKNTLNKLIKSDVEESDKKHIDEQIRVLSEMIVMAEGIKKHKFTGYNVKSDVILTTNRKHTDIVANQIKELPDIDPNKVSTFAAGVFATTDALDEILTVRTYGEILFKVKGMVVLPNDPVEAAKKVAESEIIKFLKDRHRILKENEQQPFYFRVELKSKLDLSKKSAFIKKFSTGIEKYTDRKLVNSASDYELEIRLIETKEGKYNCLVKLYTIKDNRFSYRIESMATSMKPVNAALIVELAKDYMKADAQVLDPFCGVATLLIERQKIVKGNTSYGIDINPEAVAKAKVNTDAADQIIHFINKDFFEFTHEYLFDEIITDMPFVTTHKSEDEIEEIYSKFFNQVKKYLKNDGRIIMYTHNREFVKRYASLQGFKILKHYVMLEKAGTDLFILES